MNPCLHSSSLTLYPRYVRGPEMSNILMPVCPAFRRAAFFRKGSRNLGRGATSLCPKGMHASTLPFFNRQRKVLPKHTDSTLAEELTTKAVHDFLRTADVACNRRVDATRQSCGTPTDSSHHNRQNQGSNVLVLPGFLLSSCR